MRIVIEETVDQVSKYMAHYVANALNSFVPSDEKKHFILGLPTGSSPLGMYKKLVELHRQGRVSFKNVITFNMDEYVNLPPTDPNSYHYFMYENLFNHVDIPRENINILNGMAQNLEEECAQFEAKMKAVGGVDLFLGGIGTDGHFAFNEPGSSLASRTRVKTLAYDTIVDNARFFGGDVKKVPTMALTVGVATIMDAKEVAIIITGKHKAFAMKKALDSVSHMWTISMIQMHPKALIVCDDDATLELQVKTVRYFKQLNEQAKLNYDTLRSSSDGINDNAAASMVPGPSSSMAEVVPE